MNLRYSIGYLFVKNCQKMLRKSQSCDIKYNSIILSKRRKRKIRINIIGVYKKIWGNIYGIR